MKLSDIEMYPLNRVNFVLLWDIDAEAKLFASADVEAQAVVIWGCVKVHYSAQGSIWTGLWRCATTFFHHHPSVDQIYPAHIRSCLQALNK